MASKRKLSEDFEQPITTAPATRARATSMSSTASFTLPRRLSDIDSDLISLRRASFEIFEDAPILDFSYVHTYTQAQGALLTFDRSHAHPMLNVDFHDGREPFHIHQNILAHYSPYFAERLNDAKTPNGAVSLNMHTLDGNFHQYFERHIMGYFVNWLYTQKVQDEHGYALKLVDLAKLYNLFNQFRVPGVTETMLQDIEDSPFGSEGSGHTLEDFQHYAYDKGDEELKDIALDRTVMEMPENATHRELDQILNDMPEAMVKDFTKVLMFRCGSLEKKVKKLRDRERIAKMFTRAENKLAVAGRVPGRVTYVDLTAAVEAPTGDKNTNAATQPKEKIPPSEHVCDRFCSPFADALPEASMAEGNQGAVPRPSNDLPPSGRVSGRISFRDLDNVPYAPDAEEDVETVSQAQRKVLSTRISYRDLDNVDYAPDAEEDVVMLAPSKRKVLNSVKISGRVSYADFAPSPSPEARNDSFDRDEDSDTESAFTPDRISSGTLE